MDPKALPPNVELAIQTVERHLQEGCDAYPHVFSGLVNDRLSCGLESVGATVGQMYRDCAESSDEQEKKRGKRSLDAFLANFRQLEYANNVNPVATSRLCNSNNSPNMVTPTRHQAYESASNHERHRGPGIEITPSRYYAGDRRKRTLCFDDVAHLSNSATVERHHLDFLFWNKTSRIICELCKVNMSLQAVPLHIAGKKHCKYYNQSFGQSKKRLESTQSSCASPQRVEKRRKKRAPKLKIRVVTAAEILPLESSELFRQRSQFTWRGSKLYCTLCQTSIAALPGLVSHIETLPHMQRLEGTHPSSNRGEIQDQTQLVTSPSSQDSPPLQRNEIYRREPPQPVKRPSAKATNPILTSEQATTQKEKLKKQREFDTKGFTIPNLETLERVEEENTFVTLKSDQATNALLPTDFARMLHQRPETTVTFKKRHLTEDLREYMLARLAIWEPYWEVLNVVRDGITSPVNSCEPTTEDVQMAGEIVFHLSKRKLRDQYDHIIGQLGKVSNDDMKDGDLELILWMMPLQPHHEKADGHLWPEGTFLQLNGNATKLQQRYHERTSRTWKGRCECLRLLPHIRNARIDQLVHIGTATKAPYFFAVTLTRYRAKENIYSDLLQQTETLNAKDGLEKAKALAKDLYDDEISVDNELSLRLTCPVSKRIMETPVRGKSCRHFQCFELKSFVDSNVFSGYIRWRCSVCEQRISMFDLSICSFTQQLLCQATAGEGAVKIAKSGDYKFIRTVSKAVNVIDLPSVDDDDDDDDDVVVIL